MKKALENRIDIFKLPLSFFGMVKLFLWSFVAPITKRIGVKFSVLVEIYGIDKVCFDDSTDLGTFLEVFLGEEYSISNKPDNVKTILDLGANKGYTSLYFKHVFPEAKIIAVEADPDNIQKIRRNVEGSKNILVEPSAIAPESGTMDFYLNFNTSFSGSAVKREDSARKITVPALSPQDLEKKYGVFDIVKFDIEGGEWESIDPKLFSNKPAVFIGEYHEDIVGKTVDEFLVRFKDYSVTKKKISGYRFIVILRILSETLK